MEVLQILGAVLFGLFLSVTPIPILPRLYWHKLSGLREENTGPFLFVLFAVFGALWASLPFAFIFAVGSSNALAGIVFAIAMYWNVLRK